MDRESKWQLRNPKRSVFKWLMDSDPSIRWQVMRDLMKAPDEIVATERARVATEGWGARLLSSQSPEGHWWADNDPWPWKNTLFTLVMLKDLGLDPTSEEARKSIGLVRDRITWLYHDSRPFFGGEVEPCINGRILGVGAYFGETSDQLVDRLLREQLEDGGWNCDAPPSRRSSFHSTICVLEGLLEYEKANGADAVVTEARIRGQEYLIDRGMFRSRSTGKVIDRNWMLISFPTTYHYDILRGLDYLRYAGVNPDDRIAEAVELIAKKQQQNGRWPLQNPHSDRIPFDMEGEAGTASRWNTLRTLRVLDWYSAGRNTIGQ
ncbi:hypothetical protein [Paenibacillus nasutitermitis]|uniref:Squalene cyclase C-terminal domain-containing protein n=1 Tax=Paenibacillus nasutitermitis TaxID=1652958 RepID=A0A916YTF3_9BACL|nr:hypothetical protein [Paenibacillus nasutitermitis]GGD60740.1 hypothetical protein GCM10010911_18230 [Paenibacillus nasutitermitis]